MYPKKIVVIYGVLMLLFGLGVIATTLGIVLHVTCGVHENFIYFPATVLLGIGVVGPQSLYENHLRKKYPHVCSNYWNATHLLAIQVGRLMRSIIHGEDYDETMRTFEEHCKRRNEAELKAR